MFLARTMENGKLANVDDETGIHYGIIPQRRVSMDVLNDIQQNGQDLGYEAAKEDVISAIKAALRDKVTAYRLEQMEDAIEELADEAMEDYQSDSTSYLYTEGHVTVMLSSGGDLWVFKSGITVMASQCSPCAPNAGDLTETGENARDKSMGAPVLTYGLPEDWLAKD